jgi:hypothetical protein
MMAEGTQTNNQRLFFPHSLALQMRNNFMIIYLVMLRTPLPRVDFLKSDVNDVLILLCLLTNAYGDDNSGIRCHILAPNPKKRGGPRKLHTIYFK